MNERRAYTIVLSRANANAYTYTFPDTLKADNLEDARRIGKRYCPLGGQAHIYEQTQPGNAVSTKVDTITQRERM